MSISDSSRALRFFVVLAFVAPKPPLDFSGVWVLDESASRGVSSHMRGAVLRLEQSGDRIRILPLGGGDQLLAEQIVADGRSYEKTIGNGKGVVTAAWSKDGRSLWIEVTAGPPENARAAVFRSVWKLSDDRRTWIRQSVSLQHGKKSESSLVFRRRDRPAAAPPSPRPSPGTRG